MKNRAEKLLVKLLNEEIKIGTNSNTAPDFIKDGCDKIEFYKLPSNGAIDKQFSVLASQPYDINLKNISKRIGAKWLRDNYQQKHTDWDEILKGLNKYCLIDQNDTPIIGGKCIDYLKKELNK